MKFRDKRIENPEQWNEEDCWFILGHGHAGTHFIYDILEPHFDDYEVAHQPGWNTFNPVVQDPIQTGNIIPESQHDDTLLERLKQNGPYAPIVIDPCFRYIQYKAFPDANYMWLYRNGQDFVRSSEAHHLYDERNVGGDRKTVFEWSCDRWGIFHKRIRKVEQETDITHLPFEDLVQGKCVEQLQQIIPELDGYDTEPKNPTDSEKESEITYPENWGAGRNGYFNEKCHDMMVYLGYEED